MSAFYIWMSQQDHLCMRLMEERWKTADLGEAFNAGRKLGNNEGMERAAERNDYFAKMMESGAGETEPGERLRQAAREIRMEISND